MGATKHCLVAYAAQERQHLWPVVLPADASVQDALDAARALAESSAGGAAADEGPAAAPRVEVPWDAATVGIFGEPCGRSVIPSDGDRIEIYRPLRHDPKQARRERARRRV